MDYERETRAAYRSQSRAALYQRRQTQRWSWARLATSREQSQIARLLRALGVGPGSVVLDAPCGTGILGAVLNGLGCEVLAADISTEMMGLARSEYRRKTFRGFLQADLLQLPLARRSVDGVVALGFLHRVPREIRRQALTELAAVSRGPLIASCSIDSVVQRIKIEILRAVKRDYAPAPHRVPLVDILADCDAAGLRITRICRPVPVLSSEAVLVLEHHGVRRG